MPVEREQVYERLKSVYDPEIPVDIVNLGLVYDVTVAGDRVFVKMTTTSSGCPVGNYLAAETKRAIGKLDGVVMVDVELVNEPPWDENMISPEGRRMLGWSR